MWPQLAISSEQRDSRVSRWRIAITTKNQWRRLSWGYSPVPQQHYQYQLTSFTMITPVEFSLSSYWDIALATDQENPHGKPNQHQTMFTFHEVQARIASQWRLVTIFTIITIILHFSNWPTIGACADGSHLHNQQQPSSRNLKTECKTNPYKRRLDCYLQHKKIQGSKLWWPCFSGRRASFQARVLHRDVLSFLVQSPQNACAHFHMQT